MNWLKKEVSSLELSKKLKELGYPQKGEGYWWWDICDKRIFKGESLPIVSANPEQCFSTNKRQNSYIQTNYKIKAPTCRELGEWLTKGCIKLETYYKDKFNYAPDTIIPDKLTEGLIWLIENGYISFKKGA